MPDPTAADYSRFADSRLVEARDKLQNAATSGYDDNIGEVAKVASLVWDAAIDILSALALLEGVNVTGISSDMRRYARYNLPTGLMRYWHNLARLHNFQHKPNLPEPDFRVELYYAGTMLEDFNTRLPQPWRLPAARFAWLTANPPQSDV